LKIPSGHAAHTWLSGCDGSPPQLFIFEVYAPFTFCVLLFKGIDKVGCQSSGRIGQRF
jgi:hypothetical protein